ncbi:MAG: hypothetical protein ACYS17_06810 [Planctomycetota bacterium]|jgi:hypothetical protein
MERGWQNSLLGYVVFSHHFRGKLMKYFRVMLIAYAFLLLVGCGEDEKKTLGGKEYVTWIGRDGTEFEGGQYSFFTPQGRMMVRGFYTVVPNTP